MMSWIHRRMASSDAGVTLVEMLIATFVTTLVLASTTTLVIQVMKITKHTTTISDQSFEARNSLNTFGKAARPAAYVNTPHRVGTRLYLEYLTKSTGPDEPALCTQWRYDSAAGTLQHRTWDLLKVEESEWLLLTDSMANDLNTEEPFVVIPANSQLAVPVISTSFRLRSPEGVETVEEQTFSLPNYDSTMSGEVCQEVGRP